MGFGYWCLDWCVFVAFVGVCDFGCWGFGVSFGVLGFWGEFWGFWGFGVGFGFCGLVGILRFSLLGGVGII